MKKAIFLAVLASLVLAACASRDVSQTSPAFGGNTNASKQDGSIRAVEDSKSSKNVAVGNSVSTITPRTQKPNSPVTQQVSLEQNQKSQNQPVPTERKIVRNADLQLETDAPEDAQQKITSIAESKGGFVVESTQSSSDVRAARRDTVMMTVRVPAEKFGEALDEIRKTASRVIVETVKSDDVTEEFIDVEARLKAKKSLEAQFLEIMKRANTVDDALNVQSELSDVRAEIEKIEGRLRFLQNQTSLSTVKIRLQTPAAFTSNSKGFFYRFGESVGSGVDSALDFILGFVTFIIAVLPFFLLVVLPIWLVIRYLWRRRKMRKTAAAIVAEEIKD